MPYTNTLRIRSFAVFRILGLLTFDDKSQLVAEVLGLARSAGYAEKVTVDEKLTLSVHKAKSNYIAWNRAMELMSAGAWDEATRGLSTPPYHMTEDDRAEVRTLLAAKIVPRLDAPSSLS